MTSHKAGSSAVLNIAFEREGKKVITTQGIRIWSPIQVRTPPNRCCPCGMVTLNAVSAVCLISKMRKGNTERKKSLILAGKIKSEKNKRN